VDGFLRDKKFLILDNDALFAKGFCGTLEDAGVRIVRTAYQAPDMNAFSERWVQTVKRECLSKLILFGAEHLRRVLSEFTAHYHEQRPHQGIGNSLIEPSTDEPPNGERVVVDERLGGLLRSYRRAA
ncbi:MAG: putative transposase, partial [Hyphomicrobiaceae bacterium]